MESCGSFQYKKLSQVMVQRVMTDSDMKLWHVPGRYGKLWHVLIVEIMADSWSFLIALLLVM